MRIQVREPKKDDEALIDYGQQEIIVLQVLKVPDDSYSHGRGFAWHGLWPLMRQHSHYQTVSGKKGTDG